MIRPLLSRRAAVARVSFGLAASLAIALGAGPGARAAPAGIAVTLTYQGRTPAGRLLFAYQVRNLTHATVYLVDGDRMPYVTVAAPGSVELHFDVIEMRAEPYMFPMNDPRPLLAGAVLNRKLQVAYPFKPSDHFHLSPTPAPTHLPLSVKAVQGYSDKPFVNTSASRIYREFLAWQQKAESAPIVIPHF
jgi:hypothetical protein